MKIEYETFGEPEIMGIKLIPENETDKRINDRFFHGGARAHGFNGTELTVTFSDLVTMSEMERELEDMKRDTRIPLPGSEESKKMQKAGGALGETQAILRRIGLASPGMTSIAESPAHAKFMEELRAGAGISAKKEAPKNMAAAAERFFTENPLAKNQTIRDVMDRLDPQGAPHKVIRGDKKAIALYSAVWAGLNRAVNRKVATVARRKVGHKSFKVFSAVKVSTVRVPCQPSPGLVSQCIKVLTDNPGRVMTTRELYWSIAQEHTAPEQAGKLTTAIKEFVVRTKMKSIKFKMAQHKVVFCYEPPRKVQVPPACQAGDVPSW